ncbi:hypothetical protein COU59_03255 [Candidatus Pacearchaeota archaeon CG10_big_fil_rev_8_21_14_0_10_34_12]|nr:MAG: hypothetical protein COU59_03255 [Candidatus Pacearchaeota archaeon CG10_big_fil_rev_8_21_14_0_10_34_12]
MSRPRICRRVRFKPGTTYFKPRGIPLRYLNEVVLTFEESESLRLIDLENTEQSKASKMMEVSQPTFSRILKIARKKVSDAIINGKAIRIEGGHYRFHGFR